MNSLRYFWRVVEGIELPGQAVLDVRKLGFWASLNQPYRLPGPMAGLVQFGSFADNLGIQRTGCYTVLDMEEEAIITEVRPGTQRSLGEGLDINFLQVSFRLLRRTRYEDHGYKVTLKSPAWLSQLEPSAPLNGYLMERGEFSAELAKDERINEDLKVTVEVTDV